MIGAERFNAPQTSLISASAAAKESAEEAAAKSQERLAELELLRQYLEEATEAVDKAVACTSTAVERVKKLLTAPDKKAMIIEMAEANEIDVPLMDLLQQNIEGAKAAGQAEAAAFMEKVGGWLVERRGLREGDFGCFLLVIRDAARADRASSSSIRHRLAPFSLMQPTGHPSNPTHRSSRRPPSTSSHPPQRWVCRRCRRRPLPCLAAAAATPPPAAGG